MKAWAVTGGSGFLGRHILQMAAGKADLRTLGRTPVPGAENYPLDLLQADSGALVAFLKGAQVLFHLAGMVSRKPSDADRMTRLHVDCTRKLLEAAQKAGVERVVLASTSGTVGISESESWADDESPYAIEIASEFGYYRSKIYQEKLALEWSRQTEIPLLALRPSLLLGPGDDRLSSTGDVARFLEKRIPAIPSGGVSFVDVRDTAAAFVAAAESSDQRSRTYLLTAENWSMLRFFKELESITGVRAPGIQASAQMLKLSGAASRLLGSPRFLPDPESLRMSALYWYVRAGRAAAELDFKPRTARETLKDTVDYIRSHSLKAE